MERARKNNSNMAQRFWCSYEVVVHTDPWRGIVKVSSKQKMVFFPSHWREKLKLLWKANNTEIQIHSKMFSEINSCNLLKLLILLSLSESRQYWSKAEVPVTLQYDLFFSKLNYVNKPCSIEISAKSGRTQHLAVCKASVLEEMTADCERFGHLTPKPFAPAFWKPFPEDFGACQWEFFCPFSQKRSVAEVGWEVLALILHSYSSQRCLRGSGQGLCRIITLLRLWTTLVVKKNK